jgi:N-acetylmuramoyl-L-alanine amidase
MGNRKRSQISKFAVGYALEFALFCIISALISLIFIIPMLNFNFPLPSEDAEVQPSLTIVIDAGHGGEDGGASSDAGLLEKEVNLDIALMLRDMLRANGINVVMTREDDRLLYDRSVDFKGRKKKLDLAARSAVMENVPDAIFVSIHMNSYPSPKYSGLQVFYSPNHRDSATLAETIRQLVREKLQKENTRLTKAATSSIFLLHNAKIPAVLVECGFLTNPEEAARFESSEYRQKVAFSLFCAINEFLTQTDEIDSEQP